MVPIIFLHVLGDLVWIGSILAVAIVLRTSSADSKTRGTLALRVYRTLAVPGFVLAFVCGTALIAAHPGYYLQTTHFMHPKLALALGVIAMHHLLGAHAKRMAAGGADTGASATSIAIGVALAAAGAAYLGVVKPF